MKIQITKKQDGWWAEIISPHPRRIIDSAAIGWGESKAAAVGDLVMHHREELGLEFVIATPKPPGA